MSPNTGAAHSGDGFCGLGHTRHQQLKEVLQHGVEHALVPDVCRKIKARLHSAVLQRNGLDSIYTTAKEERLNDTKNIQGSGK